MAFGEEEYERNPKAAAGAAKPRLDLLEPPADEAIAKVLAHGADKYGVQNYRDIPIHLRTYIAATRRHLAALARGEDTDADSGESHWAHIGANVHVVMGAMEEGTLHDNRGSQPRTTAQEATGAAANQEDGAKPDILATQRISSARAAGQLPPMIERPAHERI